MIVFVHETIGVLNRIRGSDYFLWELASYTL